MSILFIDFETRSLADLKDVGLDNYAKHSTTDVWCLCYAYDDGPIETWTPGQTIPWIEADIFVAHNASFELAIWKNVLVPKYGFPPIDAAQFHDTMAMAYAMSLPGSLDAASRAVGLDADKDMAGHRLMLKMSRPRSTDGTTHIWWDDEANKQRLFDYCKQDVEAERQLYNRLMPLSADEHKLWVLDYEINQRGIHLDIPSIKNAIEIVEAEQKRLNAEIKRVTGGAVSACTANGQLADWIRWQGVPVPGVAKADVIDALNGDLPQPVRTALKLRQEAAKSSTAKLYAMLNRASDDARVRGTMQYHGASTGRWAGRGIQVQNFPRPKLSAEEVQAAIALIGEGKRDELDLLFGAPMDVISSCLRGMIMAPTNHELIAADFSAIEARVLAWLAGEEKVLDIFRGEGRIYEHAAAGIYRKPESAITKDERQIGKVAVLALGYGGGVGAFQTMARGYGVQVSDEVADGIKRAYREANPHITSYWNALEQAALQAVQYNGEITEAGAVGRKVRFRQKGSFLFCQLPSGRMIAYPFPRIVTNKFDRDALQYMGVNAVTNKWGPIDTYGGKLSENITQAVARDLLAHAIVLLEDNGYKVVMHVHDEVVVEIPATCDDNTLHTIETLMAQAPAWAVGLPTAAEGWRDVRYRK